MPTTITTEVYTLDELQALGDERAVERALEWMSEAWSGDTMEAVSELLTESLADAFGKGTLEWESWDYWHGVAGVYGHLSRREMQAIEGGPFAGLTWPAGDLVESFTYQTEASRGYGRIDNVWLYVEEDGPDWLSPEYDALCAEVVGFIREVEARLCKVMHEEYEYLTSRAYLLECADANGYTFTADGKRFG